MKFIGHLDIMRYFQKVMRRADVDIRYSEGFSPHQIMSFAAPLGVGLESRGEYVDIEVLSTDSSKEMLRRINENMVEGMEALSYKALPDDAGNAMSLVAAADYEVRFREGYEPADPDSFFDGIKTFLAQEEIVIVKKTKKGERELDLKPLIYDFTISEVCNSCGDSGIIFSLLVSTGSTDNIKPELVLDHFFRSMGKTDLGKYDFFIHREDMLTGQAPDFVSLGEIGHDKE